MLRRMQALALAGALALGAQGVVAVAAYAEDVTGTAITITSQEGDHHYKAYQIFTGKVDNPANNQITEIAWGNGIDRNALLTDQAWHQAPLNTVFDSVSANTSAAEFAHMLDTAAKKMDKAELLRKLAVVITKHKTGNGTAIEKAPDSAVAPFQYKSDAPMAKGYYVIVDADSQTTAALTFPILKVVGPITVKSKSSVPESDKAIVANPEASTDQRFDPTKATSFTNPTGGGTWNLSDVADFTAGTEAEFVLRGTISKNFDNYKSYKYVFKDNLGSGLEYVQDSLKVYIDTKLVEAGKYQVQHSATPPVGAKPEDRYTNGSTLSVTFTDLKAASMQPTVTADSVVIVTYKARVKAQVGQEKPFENGSWVEYSKDPSFDGEGDTDPTPPGKTPEDKVFIFNYTLKGNKIDKVEQTKKLEGAEFIVTNAAKDKFLKRTGDEGNYTTAWVDSEDNATKFTSAEDGSFSVTGLDAGSYFLKEKKAPAGYSLPTGEKAYFAFKIAATIAEKNGGSDAEITRLELNDQEVTPANKLEVSLNVENSSFSELPETGGIGTTIFIVIGGVIMAGSLGGLVLRRRSQNAA